VPTAPVPSPRRRARRTAPRGAAAVLALTSSLLLAGAALGGCGATSKVETAPIARRHLPRLASTPLPPLSRFQPDGHGGQIAVLSSAYLFALDSARITARARRAIERHLLPAIRRFVATPGGRVVVSGYTDGLGSDAHNEALSGERAQAVSRLLVAAAIPRERIATVAHGERGAVDAVADPARRKVEIALEPAP
jgi:outer membrane protein OmpA-like peptidoglycan-associated protein